MTLFLRAFGGASFAQAPCLRKLAVSASLISLALILSGSGAKAAHPHHHSAESSGDSYHPALIKVWTARLRSGPGTDKKATALLDEGRSAIVVGKKDGWVKIRLDSGREGWLRHDLVEVAKSRVHADSNSDASAPSKHHHHADSDATSKNDSDDETRAHSHHKSSRHEEIAAAQRSGHRDSASTPAHHSEHATALHASAPHKVTHVNLVAATITRKATRIAAIQASAPHKTERVAELKVAMASDSDSDTRRTTELKFDNSGDTSNSDSDAAARSDSDSRVASESGSSEKLVRLASRGDRLVRSALACRGMTYRMGATGGGAFDCSGFTMYLFGKEGSSLPRTAAEQYDKGEAITKDRMLPGDLVFFRNTYKSGISHVGIYIGNNSFVHASGYGRGVRVDSLGAPFYINHWAGARRPH